MLPACTTELEIPKLASLVAPCALGVLFMGTHNSHIAKVLLGEISKRYTPLSLFGIGNLNNSNAPTNPIDANSNISDREAHSLCAGNATFFCSSVVQRQTLMIFFQIQDLGLGSSTWGKDGLVAAEWRKTALTGY